MQWLRAYQLYVVALVALGLFILWEVRFIAAVFFGGCLLAAAFLPIVDYLSRYMPRAVAIAVTYLTAAALIVVALIPAANVAISQSQDLFAQLPQYVDRLSQFSIPGLDQVASQIGSVGAKALETGTSIFSGGIQVFAALVISGYLSYDWYRLRGSLRRMFGAYGREVDDTMDRIEKLMGAWLRGQLLMSASVGGLVYIGLFLYGLPFAPALAIIAGFLELIPYAGSIIAAVPAILVALNQSWTSALIVACIYMAVNQIEGQLIAPLIMGNAVKLHPVSIMLALLVGFQVMGLAGAVLAVPFVSAVVAIAESVHGVYKRSSHNR